MELINQTKSEFKLGKDKDGNPLNFPIGKIIKVSDSLGKTLLRYEGVNTLDSLKAKNEAIFAKPKSEMDLLKEEATALGLEFVGNISKAKLIELIEEAKTDPDSAE